MKYIVLAIISLCLQGVNSYLRLFGRHPSSDDTSNSSDPPSRSPACREHPGQGLGLNNTGLEDAKGFQARWCQESQSPSLSPMVHPSTAPSDHPSTQPSDTPSVTPTQAPSITVSSDTPSDFPSIHPSGLPSDFPSLMPSDVPSQSPSVTTSQVPSTTTKSDDSMSDSSDSSSLDSSEPPSDVPSIHPTHEPSVLPLLIPKVPTDEDQSLDINNARNENIITVSELEPNSGVADVGLSILAFAGVVLVAVHVASF